MLVLPTAPRQWLQVGGVPQMGGGGSQLGGRGVPPQHPNTAALLPQQSPRQRQPVVFYPLGIWVGLEHQMNRTNTANYKLLLQWQLRIKKDPSTWKDCHNSTYGQQDLKVFGWRNDSSMNIQVVHSIAKFSFLRGSQELIGKAISFLGDRDDIGNQPFPVKLPTENMWKWETFTCALSPIEMSVFYNAGIVNRDKLWDPTTGTTTDTSVEI